MITVEAPPEGGRHLGQSEREYALKSWCRVVNHDGSTIAYTPDCITAELVAKCEEKV